MKKTLFVSALLCAVLGAAFAQNRLPDLKAYFAAANQLASPDWDFKNKPFLGEDSADTARFSNLTGDLKRIDSYLEFALLTYYSTAEKPWAERGNAILPLNNTRLVDRQLGAMVLKEQAELKFLDPSNTAAIGRYEGMITFISGRNGVSRAEMQEYLRQGIAATVDAEFNKISFTIDINSSMSYGCILTRSTNDQYVLSYESYFGTNTKSKKELSGTSWNILSSAMSNSGDFSPSAINAVRARAALIPAVIFDGWRRHISSMVDPYDLLTKALTDFYTTPNTENYKVVLGIYARAVLASVTNGDAFTKNMTASIRQTLASFNLIDKANRDIDDTQKLIAATEIPTGAQYGIFILNKAVGDEIFVSKTRRAPGLMR